MLQSYFPDLYWKSKEIQRGILHDEACDATLNTNLNWSDVEHAFNSFSVLPVLNPLHPFSLTTDLWSGPDHESYICLTIHFFDLEWNFCRLLLDIFLCTSRHTGEYIGDWIVQLCTDNLLSVFCLCFQLFQLFLIFFLFLYVDRDWMHRQ